MPPILLFTAQFERTLSYWDKRLANYEPPFLLRLINGMIPNAPEATVEVVKVKKNRWRGVYELHLGKVVDIKNVEVLR